MIIRRIEAKDFGCLSGHVKFHLDGINLMIAPNEQGKSTLASAILEALYGPPRPDGRIRNHQSLAALEPRNGGAFTVRLDIEVNGKEITIRRDFSAGQVRILEGGFHGQDVTENFRTGRDQFAIGDKLLGLNRDEFQKSVFAAQGEIDQVKNAADLTRVLQRIADSQGGDVTAAEAIQRLEGLENNYPLSVEGSRGNLLTIRVEKSRLEEKLEELSANLRKLGSNRLKLSQLKDDWLRKRREKDRTMYLACTAEHQEIEQQIKEEDERRASIAALENVKWFKPFIPVGSVGLLLSVLAVVAYKNLEIGAISGSVSLVVVVIGAIFSWIHKIKLREKREHLLTDDERRQLELRKASLQENLEQVESSSNGEEFIGLVPENHHTVYRNQVERCDGEIRELEENITEIDREIAGMLGDYPASLEQEKQEIERRLKRAERFEKAVAIAKETLNRIAADVHAKWADHLNEFASRAFSRIFPHYQDPQFDKDLRFTFVQPDYPGRIDSASGSGSSPRLSGGTLEQIYLIVRAAIADFLAQGRVRPPLILDEPFPYSDDERFLAGMKLLAEELAKDRQVIIFSCHEVRHQWLLELAPELENCIHEVTFEGDWGVSA